MGDDKTIHEEGAASALKRQKRIKKAPEASKVGDLSQDGLQTTQTSDQEGKSLTKATSPTDAKYFEPLLPGMTEACAARLQDIINAIKRPKPILN
jgi:hypothetical protein